MKRKNAPLLALILMMGWLTLNGAHPPTEKPDRNNRSEQAKKAPLVAVPSPAISVADAAKFTAYPNYQAEHCYKADDHNAADLCAQWRAAIAAEKAAKEARRATFWSIIATVLNAASLLAVGYALFLTVKSNNISAKSYAAFAAVEDANLVVSFPTGQLHGGEIFQLDMCITNIGRTAAIISNVHVGDDEPTLMVRVVEAGKTIDFPRFAVVGKQPDHGQSFRSIITYETALHRKVHLTVNASILDGRDRGDYWGLVTVATKEIQGET